MKTAYDCLDEAFLRDHLLSRLSPAEEARVIAHLDTCQCCQETLQSFADFGSALLETARRIGQEKNDPSYAAPEHLLAELRQSCACLSADDELTDYLDPPTDPAHLGRLAHYEILSVAGQGGMGIALKAVDEKLGRVVCLKVLARVMAASPTARKRFLREARAAAAIRSDFVVTVFAVDEHRGRPYMAMEFVSGCSLQEELRRRGPLPVEEIVRIGREVALGLSAADAQGLVHRDVKPANILLEESSRRAKITDFGLARVIGDGELTREGAVAGTPEFMSPEQARGTSVDHRSDLFSLGSVLYSMCTNRSPFAADGNLAVLKRICEDSAQAIREVRPDVPDALAQVIARLHAKRPDDRPSSAIEVESLLAACLRSETVSTRPPWLLGRRQWLTIAGSTVMAGGIFAGVFCWRRRSVYSGAPGINDQPAATISTPTASPTPFRWRPRVLLVIASHDFFYPEYGPVLNLLRGHGVECHTASTTLDERLPNATSPQIPVTPELKLADVKAANYDAIYFCGGAGCLEYAERGQHSAEAQRLIREALAAKRIVAAMGIAVVVLAEADVLRGRRAACYPFGNPPGIYARWLAARGVQCTQERVVEDGLFLTGRAPQDVRPFGESLLKRLGIEPHPQPAVDSSD